MMKKLFQPAAMFAVIASLASIALAQQVRVFRDGGAWTQEITGTLAGARNLHVKVEMGSVRVQGTTQNEISYVIRNRSYSNDEAQSRHDFEAYKITASNHGDAAWVVGDGRDGIAGGAETESVERKGRRFRSGNRFAACCHENSPAMVLHRRRSRMAFNVAKVTMWSRKNAVKTLRSVHLLLRRVSRGLQH